MIRLRYIWILGLLTIGAIWYTTTNDPQKVPEEVAGRYEWRMMMRGGKVDSRLVNQARMFIQSKTEKRIRQKDAGIGSWTEIGPKSFAGRVRAIAPHPTNPNVLFVGAASGGLWKTTNGGSTWTTVDNVMPTLSITTIIIHPTDPNIMYVGTGEGVTGDIPGAGIFKSTNGGNSWQLIGGLNANSPADFNWVNKLKFDPDDPSVIYAATGDLQNGTCGALYKIDNNGDGIPVEQGVRSACFGRGVTNMWFHPNGDMYASQSARDFTGSFGGLLKRDAGFNFWYLLGTAQGFSPDANRVEMAISKLDSSIMFALCEGDTLNFGQLFKSTDAGTSWTNMNLASPPFLTGSGNNQGAYDNSIWLDPTNYGRLLIGGIDLWYSSNGGSSFSQYSDWTQYDAGTSAHADHHVIVEASDYTVTNKKVYYGNDGGVATKPLIGGSWNLLTGPNMGTIQYYNGVSDGSKFIGGSQDNGVHYTTNNGTTWQKILGGDGAYCGFGNGNTIYFSNQNGNFHRSTDNGATTHLILSLNNKFTGGLDPTCPPTLDNDVPPFICPMGVFPDDENQLLVASTNLWHGTSAGCIWTAQSPIPAVQSIFYTAIELTKDIVPTYAFVGNRRGGVWRAPVSGGTWTWTELMGEFEFSNGPVTDIAVNPNNLQHIVVTVGGYIDNNIYLTEDGGTTWTEISTGIPALHVSSAAWHPDAIDWLYIGTDIGILSTEDRGANWNVTPLLANSEGPIYTEVTNIHFDNFGQMIVSTYGRGMWRSNYLRDILYVDKNYQGALRVGSETSPFVFTQSAAANAGNGTTVKYVSTGDHVLPANTPVLFDKKVNFDVSNGPVIIR